MGAGKKSFLERTAGALDLPNEVLPGESSVILTGNHHVAVDRHRGLRKYSPDCIVVGCPGGTVVIRGENLTVQAMSDWELSVAGTVWEVSFRRQNGEA